MTSLINRSLDSWVCFTGFTHSAFVFGCESTVDKSAIEGKDVPIGALVSFIQKGFQLMELEANLNDQGTDVYGKYASLTARDILTKDLDELRDIAREMQLKEDIDWEEIYTAKTEAGDKAMRKEKTKASVRELVVKETQTLKLGGCAKLQVFASFHADGMVRLWNLADSSSDVKEPYLYLTPDSSEFNEASYGFTRLAWSPDRRFIAVASGKGTVSIWTDDGTVVAATLKPHNLCRPTALKWSRGSRFVAVGSEDGSVTIWDVTSAPSSEHGRHQHWWHFSASGTEAGASRGAVSNLDWRDDQMFAATLDNGLVYLVSIESDVPIPLPLPVPAQSMNASQQPDSSSMDVDVRVRACSIEWDPTGCRLAVGYSNAICAVWNIPNPTPPNAGGGTWLNMDKVTEPKLLQGIGGDSKFMCWCGPRVLLVGTLDGTLQAWDVDSLNNTTPFNLLHGMQKDCQLQISALAHLGDTNIIAVGTREGNILAWQLMDGKMELEMTSVTDSHDAPLTFDLVYDVQLGSEIIDLVALGTDVKTCSLKFAALCAQNPNIYVIQGYDC